MKRIVNKAKGHKEAYEWDNKQHLEMTPEQRQQAAKILKGRYYWKSNIDVKEAELKNY